MLRITEQKSVRSAKGCFAPADYYQAGQGIIGSWGGKGATRLGLDGIVDVRCFRRLCDNLDPKTGHRVTVRTYRRRTVGYTFRFSASKSVSLLHGVTGDRAIVDAFRGAVSDSMCEMERELKARVRKGQQDTERTAGNMVWAEFIHTVASAVDGLCDPQLHAYLFVFNMTWDEQEDRWKAGFFRDIKRDAPYFQAAFRVRLANKLLDLGFGIEPHRDDFEIAGLPASVLKRFSRRTELIEQVAQERGITNPAWKRELGRKTREYSGRVSSVHALRKQWRKRLTAEERQSLASVYERKTPCIRQRNGEAMAVDQAIGHCFGRHSVVPERALMTEALKRGLGSVTVEGIACEVANRPLFRTDVNGRTMVSLRCD